jgi:hypothetical protein
MVLAIQPVGPVELDYTLSYFGILGHGPAIV